MIASEAPDTAGAAGATTPGPAAALAGFAATGGWPCHLVPGLTSSVTLTWNCAPLLRRCAESVLRHTAPPFDLLVVDKGSRDDTPRYLRQLARRDGRVRVLRRPRNEGVFARSYTMALARG